MGLFTNRVEHDPTNLNEAREIADNTDLFPIGLFYRNESALVYDTETRIGMGKSPAEKLKVLEVLWTDSRYSAIQGSVFSAAGSVYEIDIPIPISHWALALRNAGRIPSVFWHGGFSGGRRSCAIVPDRETSARKVGGSLALPKLLFSNSLGYPRLRWACPECREVKEIVSGMAIATGIVDQLIPCKTGG